MFKMHEDLLRSGGNRVGSMTMVAGLVAFFIQPVPAGDALQLFTMGAVIYFASAFNWRKKSKLMQPANNRRGG